MPNTPIAPPAQVFACPGHRGLNASALDPVLPALPDVLQGQAIESEIEYLAARLAHLADLCREHGRPIDGFLQATFQHSAGATPTNSQCARLPQDGLAKMKANMPTSLTQELDWFGEVREGGCLLRRERADYVMEESRNVRNRHRLSIASTSEARLDAHWSQFIAANRGAGAHTLT